MDRPRRNDQLGVNKIGKNIKKNPSHQPNSANGIASSRLQPQPQVYSISKNNFRSIVKQFTGSPLRDSLPQPPQNSPQAKNKSRPAVLTQINRPHVPAAVRPPTHPLQQGSQLLMGHRDQFLSNTTDSPVSMYMRYLQSSLGDSGPNGNQMQPSHEYQPQPHVEVQAQPHQPPHSHDHHSPRLNGSASSMPILPTPRFNRPPQQKCNNSLPSPRLSGRGILPSPTSQYLLRSPRAYRNLLPPRSPYPLLSPGVQYPPPLTPRSFTLSSMGQPGILGPGTFPPASPGRISSSLPFGGFPVSSPRWRDY